MKTSTKFSFDGTIQELKALLDQGLFNKRMRISFEADVMIFEEVQEPSPEDDVPVGLDGLVTKLYHFLGFSHIAYLPHAEGRAGLTNAIQGVMMHLPKDSHNGFSPQSIPVQELREGFASAGYPVSPFQCKKFLEEYIIPYLQEMGFYMKKNGE